MLRLRAFNNHSSFLKLIFIFSLCLFSCLDISSPTSSEADNDSVIDPGIIERNDGRSEVFNPPSDYSPPRLDNSFLDQYFSNYGKCEVKMRSCPSGHVNIPDGTDDYYTFEFLDKSHSACLETAIEYQSQCEVSSGDVIALFSSPYDNVISSTAIGGVDRVNAARHFCEFEFTSCLNGGAYAKFEISTSDKEEAISECLEYTSQRVIGCGGGTLKKVEVKSDVDFVFTHLHHSSENYNIVNSCENSNSTIDLVVDFASYVPLGKSSVGTQYGYDYEDTTGRLLDSTGSVFRSYASIPLKTKLYRGSLEDFYIGTSAARVESLEGDKFLAVLAGTPKYYLPLADPAGGNLSNGLPEYSLQAGGLDRLLNGEASEGGIINLLNNAKKTALFPAPANFIFEPWDAPDFLNQDNLINSFFCESINLTQKCFFHYGDPITAPWKVGGSINGSLASSAQRTQYEFSGYETYVQIIQSVLSVNDFKNTNFAGPSLYQFDRGHMQGFMDYCLGRREQINSADSANRGCEVNYITWHGSDHYEDQMSQLIRDIEWVRKNFVNNVTYAPLNIKGIIISNMTGKRDFYIPAAMLRQTLYQEQLNVDFGARSCWFKTCDFENTMGGLLNFNSAGTTIEALYEKSNMWWAYKIYDESRNYRVRSYSFNNKIAFMASLLSNNNKQEFWYAGHFLDNKKRNLRILLRNVDKISTYSNDETNIRIKHRNIAGESFNLSSSTEASTDQINGVKRKGPTISSSDANSYTTILEEQITQSDAEICLPDITGMDLHNFVIDFTPRPR